MQFDSAACIKKSLHRVVSDDMNHTLSDINNCDANVNEHIATKYFRERSSKNYV